MSLQFTGAKAEILANFKDQHTALKTHDVEGMRELLLEHSFNLHHMQWAIGLNIVFISIGIAVFLGYFRIARQRGLLLQVGE